MSKKKPPTPPKGHRRKENVPVVCRKVSRNQMPTINTIEGEKRVVILKPCKKCKTFQPINNFYFKSKKFAQKYGENDLRSRRVYCAPCWDETNR
jgi:hypothetical protein